MSHSFSVNANAIRQFCRAAFHCKMIRLLLLKARSRRSAGHANECKRAVTGSQRTGVD
jgi:hypothetical protein